MHPANENIQCYIIFHQFPQPAYQFSYQPPIPQASNLFWTYSQSPTASSFEAVWPEKAEILPSSILSTEVALPHQESSVKEVNRRTPRRPKNKRIRNSKKELESAKKNSESNIINQLYSFFNSYEKSESLVERAIRLLKKNLDEQDRIKSIFYKIVRLINFNRGRNYVNKENILSYYTPQGFIKQVPDIIQKLNEVQLLTLDELCFLFRTATAYFIRNTSITAILTSKRITMVAKNEHLKRRRKILACLGEKAND